MTEEEIRRSIFISEVPEGGEIIIIYEGKPIAKRKGSGEMELIK